MIDGWLNGRFYHWGGGCGVRWPVVDDRIDDVNDRGHNIRKEIEGVHCIFNPNQNGWNDLGVKGVSYWGLRRELGLSHAGWWWGLKP